MKIIDYFDSGHDRDPDAPCLIDDPTGRQFTYREVRERTLRIANGLLSAGLARSTRCAVLSSNDPEAFICTLSILRAGLAWTPINPRDTLENMAYILTHFNCAVLFYNSAFASLVTQIREQVPGLVHAICIDQPGEHAPGLSQWIATIEPTEIVDHSTDEDLCILAPTGGTTGLSKGLCLTHRAMSAFVMAQLEMTAQDGEPPVYLAAAPMTHASGFVAFPILARGGTIIIQPKVNAQAYLRAIAHYSVTTLFLPPTIIYDLLGNPALQSTDFSSLRYFIYGAAPMSPDKLMQTQQTFGAVMMQVYGQGECGFPVTYLSPVDHTVAIRTGQLKRLSSCGRPAPGSRLAVMDEDGQLLGNDQVGEIVVRTDMLMQGYHNDAQLTASVSRHGWHHTGDMGYRDSANFYYLVDRKKDMIISGGFNVYSAEVERALMAHPAVQDCAVIGVPHEKWGEAVKAVVQLHRGCRVSQDDLIQLCKRSIGSVKAPKSVAFVAQLPRSSNGKVLKRTVREPYWSQSTRQVA